MDAVGTTDVEQVALRLAAEDLVLALCDALDAKDAAAVGALFAADGAFAAFGPPLIGPDAIASGMAHLMSAPDQRHVVTNIRSAVHAGEVTVDAVFSVFHFGAPDAALSPTVMLQTRTVCTQDGERLRIASHGGRPLSAMPPPPSRGA
jgi:ketosteroid isomerase-like protein